MRKLSFVPVASSLLLLAGACGGGSGEEASETETLREGDPAPNFVLPAANGPKVSLEEFHGRKAALLYFSMGPG